MYKYLRSNIWVCLLSTLLAIQNCQPAAGTRTPGTPPKGRSKDGNAKGGPEDGKSNGGPEDGKSNGGPEDGNAKGGPEDGNAKGGSEDEKSNNESEDAGDRNNSGDSSHQNKRFSADDEDDRNNNSIGGEKLLEAVAILKEFRNALQGFNKLWTDVSETWNQPGGPFHEGTDLAGVKVQRNELKDACKFMRGLGPVVTKLAEKKDGDIEKNVEGEVAKFAPTELGKAIRVIRRIFFAKKDGTYLFMGEYNTELAPYQITKDQVDALIQHLDTLYRLVNITATE